MQQRRAALSHVATYAAPVIGRRGDRLLVGHPDPEAPDWIWCEHVETGRAGWVPDLLLDRDPAGPLASLRQSYDAAECDVTAGQVVEIGESIAGWTWCRVSSTRAGWVPSEKLADLD